MAKPFVHVMAPKEAGNSFSREALKYDADEAECSKDAPWDRADQAIVIFHPDSHHDGGEEWSCPNCGLNTARTDNPGVGVFVTRMLN